MKTNDRKPSKIYKALIIEESFQLRNALRHILKRKETKYEIDEAVHALEGLDMVLIFDYDVILLNLDAPHMDGLELVRQCKMHSDAKVIIISPLNQINSHIVQQARQMGADGIIENPLSAADEKARLTGRFKAVEIKGKSIAA